jgi:hypothetical protein
MSRQTMRHLHLGCGESLNALLPMSSREFRRLEAGKVRDVRIDQKALRPKKAKGA